MAVEYITNTKLLLLSINSGTIVVSACTIKALVCVAHSGPNLGVFLSVLGLGIVLHNNFAR